MEKLRECYQCGASVNDLSNRSRCVKCEEQRANFNERENEELRYSVTAARELAHVKQVRRTSDCSVSLVFPSCRLASEFEDAVRGFLK